MDNLNRQQFLDLKKVCNEEAAAKDKNSEEDNLPGRHYILNKSNKAYVNFTVSGQIMEYTVVEVPETQYAAGGHDCTSIFHPAAWAHFPVSEATKWWSKIPVKWPIVTHEYGQVSSFGKNHD